MGADAGGWGTQRWGNNVGVDVVFFDETWLVGRTQGDDTGGFQEGSWPADIGDAAVAPSPFPMGALCGPRNPYNSKNNTSRTTCSTLQFTNPGPWGGGTSHYRPVLLGCCPRRGGVLSPPAPPPMQKAPLITARGRMCSECQMRWVWFLSGTLLKLTRIDF